MKSFQRELRELIIIHGIDKMLDVPSTVMAETICNIIRPDGKRKKKEPDHESAGWMLAECCGILDRGGDPRTTDIADMLRRMKIDLNKVY